MRERTECASEHKERSCAGVAGKYACTRCGWKWTPRTNSPDPPRACARCRSAYWQSAPVSSRANWPSDDKWRVESQSVARRKQERHPARLRELAAEFGFAPPPVIGNLSVATPVFLPQELCQPGGVPEEPRSQFNEPVTSCQSSAPAPRRSLAEELYRLRAAAATIMPPK